MSSSIYIYTCRVYLDQTSTMQIIADCNHSVYIIITSYVQSTIKTSSYSKSLYIQILLLSHCFIAHSLYVTITSLLYTVTCQCTPHCINILVLYMNSAIAYTIKVCNKCRGIITSQQNINISPQDLPLSVQNKETQTAFVVQEEP